MKKTAWGFGLATAGMVFLAGQALAQSSGSSGTSGSGGSMAPGSKSTSGHSHMLHGRVQSFDRSNNTLTLAGSDKTLKVDSTTQVMKDGSRASIDDIEEGDDVRASYSGSGDTLTARKLDIMSAGAAGSSAGTGSSSGTGSSDDMSGSTSKGKGTKSSGSSSSSGDSTKSY